MTIIRTRSPLSAGRLIGRSGRPSFTAPSGRAWQESDGIQGLITRRRSVSAQTFYDYDPITQRTDSSSSTPETPASISDLVLWLDGGQPAYSDTTGTVIATSPAGRVRRIDQPGSLSGSWLAPSDAARPFREGTGAVDIHCAATPQCLLQPSGISMPADNSTLAVSFSSHDGDYPNAFQSFALGTDGVSRWGLAIFNGVLLVYRNGSFWNPALSIPKNKTCHVVARFSTTTRRIDYVIDGVAGSKSETGAIATGRVTSGIGTGALVEEQSHLAISQLLGYARYIDDTECGKLLTHLVNNPAPANAPLDAPQLVIAGDSIQVGVQIGGRPLTVPYRMLPNLYATAPIRLRNTAVNGFTLANMATVYPTTVLPLYSASRAKNILDVGGGSNSLALGSLTLAQVIAAYWAYCDLARSDGHLVIVHTLLPRSAVGTRASYLTDRPLFNDEIRANFASHAHVVCDDAAVPGMGADGDETNTTNYSDLVHPTGTGYALLEPPRRAAVNSLL